MIDRIMEDINIFGSKITMQQDVVCWSECNNTAEHFFGLKVTMQQSIFSCSQGNNTAKYYLLVSR